MLRILSCLLLLVFSYSANAISLFSSPSTHEYQLPNGLKLIVKEDHRAPVVISQIWYKVGSSYEREGITGISHALEHMMFRGSKGFGPGEFVRIIAENGGEQNAFTYYDFTAYFELLDINKLEVAFELEADRMRNLLLRPEDFAKEIQVVMEERRMRTDDSPQSTTLERFNAAAFVSSPYHHSVIGWMHDLKNMTVNDLRQWYQQWYTPNNATLVVVGDVQPAQIYQLVKRYFGSLPPSTLPLLKPQEEIKPLGEKQIIVKVPAKLPWLIMGYTVPAVKTDLKNNDPYVLQVIAAILDGGNSARLSKELVRGQQIVADVNVGYDAFSRLDGLFVLQATPAQGHTAAEVKIALLAQIKRLQDTLVSADELNRVKTQIIAGQTYKKDDISGQAEEIGGLESVGLSWKVADERVKRIKAITPQQIQAVARRYLITDHLTTAILDPLPLDPNAAVSATSTAEQRVH